jgi:hypothetical protein
MVSSAGSRRRRSMRSAKYARFGVGSHDGLGPAVELFAVGFRDAEIVGDHHGRKRLEQLGDDVAAAVRAQPLDALDDELAHRRLDGLDLTRGEPARDELAKFGVDRRVLHDERRVVGQADHLEFAVVDRQTLCRRERLVIAGGLPHVGVAGQHVVVMLGFGFRDDVVHRVVVAQRGIHRPRFGPGLGGGQLEAHRASVRHQSCHVSWIRHRAGMCQPKLHVCVAVVPEKINMVARVGRYSLSTTSIHGRSP